MTPVVRLSSRTEARAMAALFNRMQGMALHLPCTCSFGRGPTPGCPTHDPTRCPNIAELRRAALEMRRVEYAVSQIEERADADACGGVDDDGNVIVVVLEPSTIEGATFPVGVQPWLADRFVVTVREARRLALTRGRGTT